MSHHVAPCHDVATMSHYQFHFGHLLIQGDVLFISAKVWRCLKYTSICPSQGLWRGARLAWPQSFGQPLPLETVLPVQLWDPHRLHMIFYWRVRPTLPVVPARGGAEVALKIYMRPFSSIELACAVRQPSTCVRALCESGVLLHMSHLKLHFTLLTAVFTLHTTHFTLHTSHCTLHTAPFAVNTSTLYS